MHHHRRPFEAHTAEEDTDEASSRLLAKIASCGAKTARKVGYLLKERVFHIAVVTDALRGINDGETIVDPTISSRLLSRRRWLDPLERLSEREREVLGLAAEGLSNRAIAARLFSTERTVEAHVTQLFQKLGLTEETGSHRRVLVVLTCLRSNPAALDRDQSGG